MRSPATQRGTRAAAGTSRRPRAAPRVRATPAVGTGKEQLARHQRPAPQGGVPPLAALSDEQAVAQQRMAGSKQRSSSSGSSHRRCASASVGSVRAGSFRQVAITRRRRCRPAAAARARARSIRPARGASSRTTQPNVPRRGAPRCRRRRGDALAQMRAVTSSAKNACLSRS